jgi:adenine-specific DNA methylase
MLNDIIEHIRGRSYMSGIDRDQLRVKATGEVFTPTDLVREILGKFPSDVFTDPTKTFLDNSCGDGQFLGEVLIRKMENGSTFEQALQTIYGVDLMIDNVDLCRERLLCGREDLRHIVEQNIVCSNALKYKYKFPPMTDARRKKEDIARKRLQKALDKARKEEEDRLKLEVQRRAMEEKIKREKKFFGESLSA